ncbi:hypothetical protein [Actinoplanes subglobosus]|uniref:Uncharacterized protein n=1 Tax=Actinoplanes subglobosus TaxID=1547892 RepID=A0ABV8J8T3_9ACTN
MPTSTHVGRSEKPTLATIIGSPQYPFATDSAPDLLTRSVAELVPDLLVEVDTPDTTDSVDINVALMAASDLSSVVSLNLDAPDGDEGFYPFSEWRVVSHGYRRVDLTLSLPYNAEQAEPDFVIQLLQTLHVLPSMPR